MKNRNNDIYPTGETALMLRWFRCENCYSFPDESVLSMIGTDLNRHENFLYEPEGQRLLQVASIYGPNASGKSNFIKALKSMLQNIVYAPYPFTGDPCLLLNEFKPMQYEMEIVIGDDIYRYGYKLTGDRVLDEWLLERKNEPNNDFKPLFERAANTEVELYNIGMEGSEQSLQQFFQSLAKHSERVLILTHVGKTGLEPYSTVYKWCERAIRDNLINEFTALAYPLAEILSKDKSRKDKFCEFMMKFDPSISDVKVTTIGNEVKTVSSDIEIVRKNFDNSADVIFPISMESSGTIRLAGFYYFLMEALENGTLLIADELDLRLHPWIIREIIRMFHDKENWNKKGAQLIFSAHSVAAMNGQDMRIDEVYFVEKDKSGASSISRLALNDASDDFLQDTDFGKSYLAGNLGAVPEKFTMLED